MLVGHDLLDQTAYGGAVDAWAVSAEPGQEELAILQIAQRIMDQRTTSQ